MRLNAVSQFTLTCVMCVFCDVKGEYEVVAALITGLDSAMRLTCHVDLTS